MRRQNQWRGKIIVRILGCEQGRDSDFGYRCEQPLQSDKAIPGYADVDATGSWFKTIVVTIIMALDMHCEIHYASIHILVTCSDMDLKQWWSQALAWSSWLQPTGQTFWIMPSPGQGALTGVS